MKPNPVPAVLAAVIVIAAIATPAGATIVSAGSSLQPAAVPLEPLAPQAAVVKIAVIPSGATTFSENHKLQLQTGLLNASWEIQVLVDGVPAARETPAGDAAFVNGYLLSYGTGHDVTVSVTVTGTVPATPGQPVVLVNAAELDNSGSPVSGSTVTVSAPVASPPGVPQRTAGVPALTGTPAGTGTAPSLTRAGGLFSAAGLAAGAVCCGAILAAGIRRK
jgi:hypothetical protein